jgi:hypothetical protein
MSSPLSKYEGHSTPNITLICHEETREQPQSMGVQNQECVERIVQLHSAFEQPWVQFSFRLEENHSLIQFSL